MSLSSGVSGGASIRLFRLAAELRRVEAELKRLADAVVSGAAVETLRAAIRSREQERRELAAKLAQLDALQQTASQEVVEKIQAEGKSWRGPMALSPAAGRQILRRGLASPIFVKHASGDSSGDAPGTLANS